MKFAQLLRTLRSDNGRDDPAKIRAEIERELEGISTINQRRGELQSVRRQAVLDGDLDAQERIDVDLNRLARLEAPGVWTG